MVGSLYQIVALKCNIYCLTGQPYFKTVRSTCNFFITTEIFSASDYEARIDFRGNSGVVVGTIFKLHFLMREGNTKGRATSYCFT